MTDCEKYHLCTALGQSCEGCVNYDPVTVVELVRPVQVVTKCLPGFGVFKKRQNNYTNEKREKISDTLAVKNQWDHFYIQYRHIKNEPAHEQIWAYDTKTWWRFLLLFYGYETIFNSCDGDIEEVKKLICKHSSKYRRDKYFKDAEKYYVDFIKKFVK